MDIIIDACKRTLSATSKPSFKYADSILTKWHEKGIRNLSDVKELDIEHQKNKITYNQTHNQTHSSADKKSDIKSKNTFNDFNQRTYNYEALEKELLNNV
jgi:DNA replication protein DnaD